MRPAPTPNPRADPAREFEIHANPAPTTYSFTWRTPIVQPLPPPNNFEYDAYVDPRRQPVTQVSGCLDGFSPCVVVRL